MQIRRHLALDEDGSSSLQKKNNLPLQQQAREKARSIHAERAKMFFISTEIPTPGFRKVTICTEHMRPLPPYRMTHERRYCNLTFAYAAAGVYWVSHASSANFSNYRSPERERNFQLSRKNRLEKFSDPFFLPTSVVLNRAFLSLVNRLFQKSLHRFFTYCELVKWFLNMIMRFQQFLWQDMGHLKAVFHTRGIKYRVVYVAKNGPFIYK